MPLYVKLPLDDNDICISIRRSSNTVRNAVATDKKFADAVDSSSFCCSPSKGTGSNEIEDRAQKANMATDSLWQTDLTGKRSDARTPRRRDQKVVLRYSVNSKFSFCRYSIALLLPVAVFISLGVEMLSRSYVIRSGVISLGLGIEPF